MVGSFDIAQNKCQGSKMIDGGSMHILTYRVNIAQNKCQGSKMVGSFDIAQNKCQGSKMVGSFGSAFLGLHAWELCFSLVSPLWESCYSLAFG